jgi:hypothetical protein
MCSLSEKPLRPQPSLASSRNGGTANGSPHRRADNAHASSTRC